MNRPALLSALRWLSAASRGDRRTIKDNPFLSGTYLRGDGDHLRLAATNGRIYASAYLESSEEVQPTVADTATLLAIVSAVEGDEVSISADEKRLHLSATGSGLSVKIMPGAGFPAPPEVERYTAKAPVEAIAAATTASRGWLGHNHPDPLWATFDIASVSIPGRYEGGHWGAEPAAEDPAVVLVDDLRLVGEMGDGVRYGLTPHRAYFKGGERMLSIPRGDQPVPDAWSIINHARSQAPHEVEFDVDDLLGALKTLLPLAGEEHISNYVEILIGGGEAGMRVRSNLGSGEAELHPLSGGEEKAKMRFAAHILRRGLQGVEGKLKVYYADNGHLTIVEGEAQVRMLATKFKEEE